MGFSKAGITPVKTIGIVRGGYQPNGENNVAPNMSDTAPVKAPATGPKRRLTSMTGILPKLILALLDNQMTRNLESIILVAAKSEINIRILVFIFFIEKSPLFT